MDIFDKIINFQGSEEDAEFMPLVSIDEDDNIESHENLPTVLLQ